MKAEVLTTWSGDGKTSETGYHPTIMDDYPHLTHIDEDTLKLVIDQEGVWSFSDTTGQPIENLTPNPNLYIVQIECAQTTLDAIKADTNYQVLWHE